MEIDKHIYEDLNTTLADICETQQVLIACLVYDKKSEKLELITDLFKTHAKLELAYKRVNTVFHKLIEIERIEEKKKEAKEDTTDTVKVIREDDPKVLELLNHETWWNRAAIAKLGLHLDKLVDDTDCAVRKVVAQQGYGLDRLVNDESCHVRTVVAEQGYGLDKLVDDDHWIVRVAVAEQGYGLEKLKNDENKHVRVAAKAKLAELEAGEKDE